MPRICTWTRLCACMHAVCVPVRWPVEIGGDGGERRELRCGRRRQRVRPPGWAARAHVHMHVICTCTCTCMHTHTHTHTHVRMCACACACTRATRGHAGRHMYIHTCRYLYTRVDTQGDAYASIRVDMCIHVWTRITSAWLRVRGYTHAHRSMPGLSATTCTYIYAWAERHYMHIDLCLG